MKLAKVHIAKITAQQGRPRIMFWLRVHGELSFDPSWRQPFGLN